MFEALGFELLSRANKIHEMNDSLKINSSKFVPRKATVTKDGHKKYDDCLC